jgi:hypothetical protein
MIRIEFTGDLSQVLAFREDAFFGAVARKMTALFDRLQNKIVAGKLSGEVLHRRSGLLAASVSEPEITTHGTTVEGFISAAGAPAQYGIYHERGTTQSYTIRAVDKKALRMLLGGKEEFRAKVIHPPLPQRAWFDPAVEEMREEFVAALKQACIEGISGE